MSPRSVARPALLLAPPRNQLRGVSVCLLAALVFVVACVQLACAATPVRQLDQFQHAAWTPRDGAPADIWAMDQATDGHLWLGTGSGVFTFDGMNFTSVPAPRGERWLSGNVTALLLRGPGDVWVGYYGGGTSRLHQGRLAHFPGGEQMPSGTVYRMAAATDGDIWAATTGGLARWNDGRWHRAGESEGVPEGPVFWVQVDAAGDVWIAATTQLLRRKRGRERFEPTQVSIGIQAVMAESADGTLWLSDASHGTRRLRIIDDVVHADALQGLEHMVAKRMLPANDGGLWLTDAQHGGMVRLDPSTHEVQAFRRRDGLTSDMAVPLLQDAEGNIWIGTNLGLNRFRRRDATMLAATLDTAHRGLGLTTMGDGIAVATGGRLLRERDGGWTSMDGLPEVMSMVASRDGAVWLLGRALWNLRDDVLREVPLPSTTPTPVTSFDVLALAAGPDDAIWASLRGAGLYRLDARGWHLAMPQRISQPQALAFDADGRLWTGDAAGRVFWLKDDRIGRLPVEGLDVGVITALLPARRHFLVAGERGLARFSNRTFHMLRGASIADFSAITGMAEAGDGRLWLNGGRGVVTLAPDQVASAFTDQAHYRYRLFDERDGLLGVAVQSSATATVVTGSDGRIWFSTNQGVAWIDPARIGHNPRPPTVLLRSFSAGGIDYRPGARLELPARTRNLAVGYTATSLGIPERVGFRYRLAGVDETWQDVGARREAFYTNLSPGDYRFEVLAANENGVWSREPAVQTFHIRPVFYQTRWFLLSCLLLAAGSLWIVYLMRLRQLGRHIRSRLQERHAERERIARELHDTLLQSIQGLILRFQAVAETLPPLDPARSAMEHALQRADDVLVEGRDRVLDLRATAPDAGNLEELLAAAGQELATLSDAHLEICTTGTPEVLDPIVRDEIYRIGREAILNALRHAGADRVVVEVDYGRDELRIRVFDDGRGIDEKTLEHGRRPGHWGLHGMRERAERIGARLRLWSRPGAGTEVELRLPADRVYRPRLRHSRWPRLRAIFMTKKA